MFELFNHDARIPFIRYGRYTVAVSVVLMLVSIVPAVPARLRARARLHRRQR